MPTTPMLIHLPSELADRFRRSIPARQRSKLIQQLLEQALPPEDAADDPLYRIAMAVESDEALAAEMQEWEEATIEDGFQDVYRERRSAHQDE
jgi:hypothetical protein